MKESSKVQGVPYETKHPKSWKETIRLFAMDEGNLPVAVAVLLLHALKLFRDGVNRDGDILWL